MLVNAVQRKLGPRLTKTLIKSEGKNGENAQKVQNILQIKFTKGYSRIKKLKTGTDFE